MSLRERIVHEALRLFSLKGYLSTSIDDILAATGASKGGLYNHFKSKDELFLVVLEEARKIWREKVLDSLGETDNHLDKVIHFLNNYRDRYLRDAENIPGGCIFVTLSVELDDQRPEFAEKVRLGYVGVKKILLEMLEAAQAEGQIKPGVDPAELSELIFTGMIGSSVLFGMDKSRETLARSIDPLIGHLERLRA